MLPYWCSASDAGHVFGVVFLVLWRGLSSTCLRLFVLVLWLAFAGCLGGITTIGGVWRRVAGVSVVYGCKIPRGLLKVQSTSAKCVGNGVFGARWTAV